LAQAIPFFKWVDFFSFRVGKVRSGHAPRWRLLVVWSLNKKGNKKSFFLFIFLAGDG
jgi:hypothetical protein